jgi:predicted cobalt transporter CbtA
MPADPEEVSPTVTPAAIDHASTVTDTAPEAWSIVGTLAGRGSILAAIIQFVCICGSPRLLFFHASDAAPATGNFDRFDRLFFLIPALVATALGLVALRFARSLDSGIVGIVLAFLSLLLVSRMGFSK